jgi:signal transduction histidine kinase
VVAHELRAPLTALLAASEVLDRDIGSIDASQVTKMVRAIRSRTVGLQALVENLLTAGSMSDGRFRIQQHVVDVRQTCAEAVDLVQPILTRRGQRLRQRMPAGSTLASIDDRRIALVLVNLIVNAGKFSPPGSVIDLSMAVREGQIRVTVSDRGPGFSGSPAALFAPYAQLPLPQNDGMGGVGLGLSIVQNIVGAHGGRVGACRRRGGGARFWFELSGLAAAQTTSDNEERQTA